MDHPNKIKMGRGHISAVQTVLSVLRSLHPLKGHNFDLWCKNRWAQPIFLVKKKGLLCVCIILIFFLNCFN